MAEWGTQTHLVQVIAEGVLESLHPLQPGVALTLQDPWDGMGQSCVEVRESIPCPTSEPDSTSKLNGFAVWFTGLSGSGKSTLCRMLAAELGGRGVRPVVLDGDEVRRTICRGLGYSREDRDENIRRIGFVASSLVRRGEVVLVAAIAPYRAVRSEVRRRVGRFVEVYVNAPLAVCEERDAKGLYAAARAGRLTNFTGIDAPYEAPLAAEVECRTDRDSPELCVAQVLRAVEALPKLGR